MQCSLERSAACCIFTLVFVHISCHHQGCFLDSNFVRVQRGFDFGHRAPPLILGRTPRAADFKLQDICVLYTHMWCITCALDHHTHAGTTRHTTNHQPTTNNHQQPPTTTNNHQQPPVTNPINARSLSSFLYSFFQTAFVLLLLLLTGVVCGEVVNMWGYPVL